MRWEFVVKAILLQLCINVGERLRLIVPKENGEQNRTGRLLGSLFILLSIDLAEI